MEEVAPKESFVPRWPEQKRCIGACQCIVVLLKLSVHCCSVAQQNRMYVCNASTVLRGSTYQFQCFVIQIERPTVITCTACLSQVHSQRACFHE